MTTKRDLWIAIFLGAIACAVYLPALGVGFYSDDYEWLGRMNATLERPTYVLSVIYRDFNPVLHLSFLADWIVGRASARVWHVQSIALHGLCTGLLFVLLRSRAVDFRLAGAAALTWALNVRVSETAIWPAARGHALATFFTLAGLALLGSRMRGRRSIALALFAVGLFSKETALFPLLLVPWFLDGWKKEGRFLGAVAALAAGFVAFNLLVKDELHTSGDAVGTLVLKVGFILLRPLGLGDLYAFDWIAFGLVVAAFTVAAWWLRRTPALVGFLWIAICTVPLIPLQKLSARYLYLLSVGYAFVLCGVVGWVWPRLTAPALRRAVGVGLAALLALVTVANAIDIQREIEDYRLLAKPYARCADAFHEPLRSLRPGETLVVLDVGPRDTVRELNATILERGNIVKLIPYRRHGVDGLIDLTDLLNTVRERTPGMLGSGDAEAGPRRWYAYDGVRARELSGPPTTVLPADVVHTTRWDRADAYFR